MEAHVASMLATFHQCGGTLSTGEFVAAGMDEGILWHLIDTGRIAFGEGRRTLHLTSDLEGCTEEMSA
jgi:hypothetical protein